MSLDPAASPWPGVIASVAVCLWIAAIGALLSYAVFRDRPRLVWPFYAPIVGVAVVLLVTNLAAYVMPGAPSAWFGLIAPTVLGVVVVRRGGHWRQAPRGSRIALLAMGCLAVGVFALAYANRLHTYPHDASWHYALIQRLSHGEFPPVTPYGVDAGIGYHYGADLLAATIVSTTGALPWTAFDALATLLIVGLVLGVAGFAYDVGTPLTLASGLGVAVGLFDGDVFLGYRTGYIEGLAFLDPPLISQVAFEWISLLQRPIAVGSVVLVAATLHGDVTRRRAALLAAGAGVLALGDASVMIFATAALTLVGTARMIRLRGRERLVFAGALLVSALLVALAGGPVSDEIFGRGGTVGTVGMAWEPITRELLPFYREGPTLVAVGIIPLAVVGAFAAHRRRSWGLGVLAAAGALGLLESQLLQSQLAWHDWRIIWLAVAVAMIGGLAGIGALVGALQGRGRRILATAAVGLLVMLPTALPRAVAGIHLAFSDLEVADPAGDASGHHHRDRTALGRELGESWEFYDWLRGALPAEARLLTPRPHTSAVAAGAATPVSHRDHQMFIFAGYTTWVYEDALRFLHRDDLAELGITHLHVTDQLEADLAPAARRLLDDPRHLRLLTEISTSSGARHRVYEAVPGAGTTAIAPNSYRAFRQLVPPGTAVTALGSIPFFQRMVVLSAFADRNRLQSPVQLLFERGTRSPEVTWLDGLPASGVAIMREPVEPTALGLSRADAIWTGHGLRAYDLAAAWSSVAWRIGPDRAGLPGPQRAVCESADGEVDLHLLGEPGTRVSAGSTEIILTGLPQVVSLTAPDCGALTLSADSAIAPFVQIRPHHAGVSLDSDAPIAGLGFDGGVDGERAVLNFWYRNPDDVGFVTGTEFRLYNASHRRVSLWWRTPNPRASSLRWWPGPAALHAPEQIARIEFDARRLEINGDSGGGAASSLTPGQTYLLTLNVVGTDPRYGLVEIQQVVPLARVVVGETSVSYETLSGIVTIEHHAPGTIYRRTGYDGGLTRDAILTPR